ncbi:collagen alpha chain CG42342-like [Thunnus albacares]|uniref:collagen alpha chain CG42342-like n=1 Tax=Thunnus albacares TaxID=8236 RepID=UPI001CF69494|nr:collagen alpha chain CG42342-like [Thunnus albacares]
MGPDGEEGRPGAMGQSGEKGQKGDRGWRGLYGDIGTPGMIKYGEVQRSSIQLKWSHHGVAPYFDFLDSALYCLRSTPANQAAQQDSIRLGFSPSVEKPTC